jgi:hypothetical protein
MDCLYASAAVITCYANDNDAFIPEIWAQESLYILEENMVVANMVHRDFENSIASYGDVVNTRRPGEFKIRRKNDSTSGLEHQDAAATNVQVKLDQWFYTSFVIKDGEASMAFQDLIDIYLRPAMATIARSVDRAVLGRSPAFLGTPAQRVGRLRNLTKDNAKDFVLEAREILNKNKAPVAGRSLVLGPASETAMLKTDLFLKADERGDGGNALQNAILGRILGFNTYMAQNVSSLDMLGVDVAAGTVTNALAAGGSGERACMVTGYAASVGEFATVAGNDQPTYITAATAVADTTAVTLHEANKYGTEAGAAITIYKKCLANGAFSANHIGKVLVDGYSEGKAPQVGQLVAFGTGSSRRTYTIIESEEAGAGVQAIWLDRPLEAAIADGDPVFPGPAGSLNMAFCRDAMALVTRPLAVPNNAMGVLSGYSAYNDIAMRVSMQYDLDAGGTKVNLDMLAGVAVLDPKQCVILLG